MKRTIILFPVKDQISKTALAKLSNKQARGFYRYSIVITPTQENLEGKNFDVDLQYSACSPFDKFNRKTGYELAITKPKIGIRGVESKEHLEAIIDELVFAAKHYEIDFDSTLRDTAKDGIITVPGYQSF